MLVGNAKEVVGMSHSGEEEVQDNCVTLCLPVLSRSRRRPKSANGEDDEDSSLRRVYLLHGALSAFNSVCLQDY